MQTESANGHRTQTAYGTATNATARGRSIATGRRKTKRISALSAAEKRAEKWKKAADVSDYEIYLKVIKKTTFGAFTVDAAGGTVPGGFVVEVMANDNI
jgi:hypothetical protein